MWHELSALGWAGAACLVIVAAVVVALVRGKHAADHVLLAALGAAILAGVVSPQKGLSGFSNTGMATVALLFIVSEGLTRHGGLRWFVSWMLGARHLRGQLLKMSGLMMVASAVLNNTAVVAMFLPDVKKWSSEHNVSSSKLLIPLSYAAILGGTCTLIGTSTNLLVAGMVQESTGQAMSLLSIAPVGIPMALLGGLFMLVLGPMLLPERGARQTEQPSMEELALAARVQPDGPLVGRRLDEIAAHRAVGLYPVEIVRDGQVIPAPSPQTKLKSLDLLVFAGRARALVELSELEGLELEPQHSFSRREGLEPGDTVEVVLTARSPLVGKEIGNGRFRQHYDAAVLAILREGRLVTPDAQQRWVLSVGDRLMVEVGEHFKERILNDDFIVLLPHKETPSPLWKRAFAMVIVTVMVVLAAASVVDIFIAALGASLLMIVTGLLSFKQALLSVDRRVVLTIAAAIGLGEAIQQSGVAKVVAQAVVTLGAHSAWGTLVLVYLVCSLLTQFVTNNAAAVIVLPFALTAAQALDVSAMPYIVAVMMAASASFATPFGYQTNLMVYGAGNYQFSDFVRIGLPMNLLCAVVVLLLIPYFFPF